MLQTWPLKLTSMLSKFLKNQEQKEAENRQKIKTDSLNSKFTGSKKERVYFSLFTFEKL